MSWARRVNASWFYLVSLMACERLAAPPAASAADGAMERTLNAIPQRHTPALAPSEVKAAVTGDGRADKAQVAAMVARLLRLDEPPKPADAADALALAICHVWRGSAPTGSPRRIAGRAVGRSARPLRRPPKEYRR